MLKQLIACTLALFMSCSSGSEMMDINYSGNKLDVSEAQAAEMMRFLEEGLKGCSDFYSLIVTQKTIEELKKEAYVEISFKDSQEIVVRNDIKLRFDAVVIPLEGRYASGDQMTFFLKDKGTYQSPYVNTQGLQELKDRLENWK